MQDTRSSVKGIESMEDFSVYQKCNVLIPDLVYSLKIVPWCVFARDG